MSGSHQLHGNSLLMSSHKQTIKDVEVRDKRVIVRVDFNVPMDGDTISNDGRIQATMPTLHNLLGRKAKIVIISHLGRPEGTDDSLRLDPIAAHLSELLGIENIPVLDPQSPETAKRIEAMQSGEIVMLENIRFYEGEMKNHMEFAKTLASFGEVYVNDAFAVSHRTHASVTGIPDYIPGVAGFLLEEEIRFLKFFLKNPAKPIIAIVGGKKVSTKISVLDAYLDTADSILVGGGAANTLLKAWGDNIGTSFYEESMLDTARELIWKAARCKTAVVVPTDAVVTSALDAGSDVRTVATSEVPDDMMIVDIGPKTIARFQEVIRTAGTVIWSGPLGVTEDDRFTKGNDAILHAIAQANVNSVIGGGDTLASIAGKPGVKDITHISTGGGATLEFIEKGTLPGIEVLTDA